MKGLGLKKGSPRMDEPTSGGGNYEPCSALFELAENPVHAAAQSGQDRDGG